MRRIEENILQEKESNRQNTVVEQSVSNNRVCVIAKMKKKHNKGILNKYRVIM